MCVGQMGQIKEKSEEVFFQSEQGFRGLERFQMPHVVLILRVETATLLNFNSKLQLQFQKLGRRVKQIKQNVIIC